MMTSLNSRVSSTVGSGMSRPATEATSVSLNGAHNFRPNVSAVRGPGGPQPPVVHIASHTEVFADDRSYPDNDGKIGVSLSAFGCY